MIEKGEILKKVAKYTEEILTTEISSKFVYHDHYHTERVVDASQSIGKACGLSVDELEIVAIAAWFHDTGYRSGCNNHEKDSAKIAEEFLTKQE